MKRRTIRWTRLALRRLDQIGAWIASDNEVTAAGVVARLVSAADALAVHPAMGRVGRIAGTRELVLADIPFITPYRVTAADIEILTVMRTAQKWPERL